MQFYEGNSLGAVFAMGCILSPLRLPFRHIGALQKSTLCKSLKWALSDATENPGRHRIIEASVPSVSSSEFEQFFEIRAR
jgi:hypothetical protein